MDFFTGIILASSVGAIAMRTQNQRNMIVLISFNNVEHNLHVWVKSAKILCSEISLSVEGYFVIACLELLFGQQVQQPTIVISVPGFQ